jgi:ABC-type polysaccharide/polyol phosphate transport system ATPase subunit
VAAYVIELQNVSKVYKLYARTSDRLRELVPFRANGLHRAFWALRDINLRVEPGEMVAIMGPNGSGKSTLLQIVAGILQPTTGRVLAQGRVAALLELGAGFNPEFSGRENVLLKGEILGLSRAKMEQALPEIEAFAGIGEFVHRPVKEYSSGMYVRLAFAAAIHVEPDILIVDEALAVGDAIFANRCIQKFEQLKRRGITILFVSHDLGLVKRLATRAVLLLEGRQVAEGLPVDVVNRYVGHVLERSETPGSHSGSVEPGKSFRHGDGASRITDVSILSPQGERISIARNGEELTIQVTGEFIRSVSQPIVGILIRSRLGVDVFGTNTRLEGQQLGDFQSGDQLMVRFTFLCLLAEQEYTLTAAVQYWEGFSQDWWDDARSFSVLGGKRGAGLVSFPTVIEWQRRRGPG